MNKQETVKAISVRTGLTQVDVNKVFTALKEVTIETLQKGEKLQLTGFWGVEPAYRAPRKGFDPIKKEPMEIEATVGVRIKAGEELKKAVKALKVEDFAPAEKAE